MVQVVRKGKILEEARAFFLSSKKDSVMRWIFFYGLNVIISTVSYFLFMRRWFSRSFKSFSLPYAIINFSFASMKLLTNFLKCLLRPSSKFSSL
jgi:hypothetical protein